MIPWPKIDGSLPIQSPDSVSPNNFSRSKPGFEPHIIGRFRRKSTTTESPIKKSVQPLDFTLLQNKSKQTNNYFFPNEIKEDGGQPQSIILKIPSSESEGKENSESDETQKQETVRDSRPQKEIKVSSLQPERPRTKERSTRKLEYVKYLFLDK